MRRIPMLILGALLVASSMSILAAGCGEGAYTPSSLAPTTTVVSGTTGVEWPEQIWTSYGRSGDTDVDAFVASAAGQKSAEYQKLFYLFSDEMDPTVLAYYEGLGIKKEMHEAGDPDQKWASYTPLPALEEGNKYKFPVVFDFVGGEKLIFSAEGHGFAQNAYQYGYIAVLPANPLSNNTDAITPGQQVTRILDALEEQGYPIDRSRVYVIGMSMGGAATLATGLEIPEVVAAGAALSSTMSLTTGNWGGASGEDRSTPPDAYEKAMDYDVPMLIMGGDLDFGGFPITEQGVVEGLNLWLQVDDCTEEADLVTGGVDEATAAIGVAGGTMWTETIGDVVHYGEEFYNADGVKMVELVCVTNLPHWPSGTFFEIAWEFLSRFSKDGDGNLVVSE